MKKNLFLMFVFGVALLLGSCSQDEVENNEGGTAAQSVVCFSSGSHEATRTSMDPNGTFYWTSGDYIFVKNGSAYIPSNNDAGSRVPRANFYLPGNFDINEKYPVVYIGNGKKLASDIAAGVEIKNEQVQTVADNSDHLGDCGDCGNDTAAYDASTGNYRFDIIHRASYFVIAPRHTFTGKEVKLQKIEVTTTGSDDLCGIYDFDETTTTLKGKLRSGGQKMITLTASDFPVPTVEEVESSNGARFADARCYMVFQPGVHTLTFKYTVTIDGESQPREFIKNVTSREFKSGYFTNVKHILAEGLFNGGHQPLNLDDDITDDAGGAGGPTTFGGADYYEWDAVNPYGSSTGAGYNTIGYPTTASQIAARSAKQSCKDMPNANEMYWYLVNGDPHWDTTTPWSIDGGLTEYTNGLWLKTKDAILAEGKQFSSTVGKGGVDMRLTAKSHSVTPSLVVLPVADRSKYFFLPALGSYYSGGHSDWRSHGWYWSSSPSPVYASYSYCLYFLSSNAFVYDTATRGNGFTAGSQWFR